MDDETTIGRLLEEAVAAYATLQALGEEVEDEWTYVTDLTAAWRTRLDAVAAARAGEPVAAGVSEAVERIVAEVRLIGDPHRAIDWLSTFPQVVLVALGEGL